MNTLVSSLWVALSLLCLSMAIRHAPASPAKRQWYEVKQQWYLVSFETQTMGGTVTGTTCLQIALPLNQQRIQEVQYQLRSELIKIGRAPLPEQHVIILALIPLDK